MKLYIIGNGFDSGAHGFKSSYSDFKNFVYNRNKLVYKILNEAESIQNNKNEKEISFEWSNFENNLEFINIGKIVRDFEKTMEPVPEKSKKEVINEIIEKQRNYEKVIIEIDDLFHLWVNSIEIEGSYFNKQLKNDDSRKFLTFNYTDTLEKLYNIKNVNHIHLIEKNSRNVHIYGHKKSEKPESNYAFKKIDTMFEESRIFIKPVAEIIESGTIDYKDLTEIYFWGFSLSEVDKPYIEKIFDDNKSTIKNVYLCKHQFESSDKVRFVNFLKKYNLENKLKSFDDELKDKTNNRLELLIITIIIGLLVYCVLSILKKNKWEHKIQNIAKTISNYIKLIE